MRGERRHLDDVDFDVDIFELRQGAVSPLSFFMANRPISVSRARPSVTMGVPIAPGSPRRLRRAGRGFACLASKT